MDRLLRPEKFSTLHSDHNAEKKWKHWKKCFNSFVAHVQVPAGAEAVDKLALLVNYVDPEVDEYITEDASFESAIQTLDSLYLKPVNTIYARYVLASRKQESSESLDCFLQVLKGLSKACQFKLPKTAQEYEDEYVRDSFISGLSSPSIRQRLLEEKDLTLDQAYQKARSMEIAQLQSQSYQGRSSQINVNAIDHLSNYTSSETSSSGKMSRPVSPELPDGHINAVSKRSGHRSHDTGSCDFCGNSKHSRAFCPARDVVCQVILQRFVNQLQSKLKIKQIIFKCLALYSNTFFHPCFLSVLS